MNNAAQDIKSKVSAHMSTIDSKARSTISDIQSSSSSRVGDIVHKASYQGRQLWERYLDFSRESPAVSAFLTIQLLLAAIPLAIFATCIISTLLTVGFFAALIVGSVLFTTGCVLAFVLSITGAIGFGIFASVTSCYLALRWFTVVRRLGVQRGTREFLFGVERQVKKEAVESKVYALRAEDKLAEQFEGSSKLGDVVPGIGNAA